MAGGVFVMGWIILLLPLIQIAIIAVESFRSPGK